MNNFESKSSLKTETNTRGHNTTIQVYDGVTFQEIDETVEKTMYAHSSIQHEIKNKNLHYQKCVQWVEITGWRCVWYTCIFSSVSLIEWENE